jgi:hypothetical protein
MITGAVTADREAVIRMVVRGPAGQEQEVEAVVDTGFDGRFALWRTRLMGLGSIKPCRLPWLNTTLIGFRILARLPLASGRVPSHISTSTALTVLRLLAPHRGSIHFLR